MCTRGGKILRASENKREEQLNTQEESVLLSFLSSSRENLVAAEAISNKDEPAGSTLSN